MKKKFRAMGLFIAVALITLSFVMPAYAVNVGIYCGKGTASDKVVAIFRALNSMGFVVKGFNTTFIYSSNFNPADFDVILIGGGTDESKLEYELSIYEDNVTVCMGNPVITAKLKSFVNNGGGIIGLERGANYIIDKLGIITSGSYSSTLNRLLNTITYADATFGSGTQVVYKSVGGGYLSAGTGQVIIAKDSSARTVIARNTYGSGRIILSAYNPELRADSMTDGAQWDNWLFSSTHANSVGCWQLLGKMVNWVDTGSVGSPVVTATEPTGTKIAVVSSWYYAGSEPGAETYGGAAPTLLPAIAKAVEYSGYVPVSIRWDEITKLQSYLTVANFKAVIFPGGYSYGYKKKIGDSTTSMGGEHVSDYIKNGGGALGICAGAYYMSDVCHWDGNNYDYLPIFTGTDSGPLTVPDYNQPGLYMPDPNHAMTLVSVQVNDSLLYPTGNNFAMYQVYFGGGYKTGGISPVTSVTYNSGYDDYDTGDPSAVGFKDAIRFEYAGTSTHGHVYLIGTHPEARCGSLDDWSVWDNYDSNGNALTNPDNTWTFFKKVLDNWLCNY